MGVKQINIIGKDISILRRLCIDKANVARAVSALESKGYMIRSVDKEDGGARLVSLTIKGQKVRNEIERISSSWIDLLSDGIDAREWDMAATVLSRITGNAVRFSGYNE